MLLHLQCLTKNHPNMPRQERTKKMITRTDFYSDKTWKAGGWIGSKDQGSYSIVDNRMNVKDATEYEWLLRLNYSEEDYDTFGLVVAENMMYLSTLGDNDTKTFYEFQHRSEK